jgi:hypothetical protein
MIRILAIKFLNTILVFQMAKSLLKKLKCALTILAPCSVFCKLSKVEKF